MSDFVITNLITGGARIREFRSSLGPYQKPIAIWELSPEQFSDFKNYLSQFPKIKEPEQ